MKFGALHLFTSVNPTEKAECKRVLKGRRRAANG
jgi:hypothetical protein